ncbi:alkaline phosphatase family protein [Renibacterium salmoninarum]|nr:alkaline phosphatase family protein [Renibacterium salmoninarum]
MTEAASEQTTSASLNALTGPNGSRLNKSLLIGLDGTLLSKAISAKAPNISTLMANGVTGESLLYSQPTSSGVDRLGETSSGPGWSSILTGVWPDKHGVQDNSFSGKNYTQYPDYLTRMKQVDPTISTFAAADWTPILT